jgi:sugar phosphate isomerase/epimerase
MFVYLDGKEPDEALAPVKELGFTCCEVYLNSFSDAYATKLRTIQDVGLDNQGVGLDTANLILCGKGHPLDALEAYGRHLKAKYARHGSR